MIQFFKYTLVSLIIYIYFRSIVSLFLVNEIGGEDRNRKLKKNTVSVFLTYLGLIMYLYIFLFHSFLLSSEWDRKKSLKRNFFSLSFTLWDIQSQNDQNLNPLLLPYSQLLVTSLSLCLTMNLSGYSVVLNQALCSSMCFNLRKN